MRLLKRGRKLLRVRDKRALATASCADRCCEGGCPNYVLARWCCEPERTGWVYMNRQDCPGYRDWLPSFSATEPQTFKVSPTASDACWTTDPVPEGNVRTYADIPGGAFFVPVSDQSVIVDSCLVPECLNCPECCGSRTMPDGCGDGGNGGPTRCCECGDNYTLTITETMTAAGFGTHYADPCTTFPATGHTQPTWNHEFNHTATFRFECEEVSDGNGGTVLRRRVVGQSVVTVRRLVHYALIDYTFPAVAGDPCILNSMSQGRTEVQTDETFTRSWEELGAGGEGCGLTRRAAAQLGPSVGGLGTFGLAKHGVGVGRFDTLGECFGTEATWFGGCSVEAGGDFGVPCQFGVARIGSEVQWTGSQSCSGGAFSESGEYTQTGGLPATAVVNGGPPFDVSWLGAETGTWAYSLRWSTGGGDPCQSDPCQNQNPVGLAKSTTSRVEVAAPDPTQSMAERLKSILAKRIRKGCNCGRK